MRLCNWRCSPILIIYLNFGKVSELLISPYSVRIRENADQKKSEYGRILFTQCRSHIFFLLFCFARLKIFISLDLNICIVRKKSLLILECSLLKLGNKHVNFLALKMLTSLSCLHYQFGESVKFMSYCIEKVLSKNSTKLQPEN